MAYRKLKPRGRPFPKGVSGNPAGPGRKTREQLALERDVKKLAKEHTVGAVRKLAALMNAEPAPIGMRRGKPVMAYPSLALQKECAVELLDRGHGKPGQSVELNTNESLHVVVSRIDLVNDLEGRMASIQERLEEQTGALQQPN